MEVRLQQRKGKNKTTLNLMIWVKEKQVFKTGKTKTGKWRIEPLKLYLYPGRDRKAQNDETLALAKIRQTTRQAELQSGEYGLIPEHKRKGDFVLFFDKLAKAKDTTWQQAARHLKAFSPAPAPFQSMNENWLLDFQTYLLKKAKSKNTAWILETKVRAGIREARRQRLIRLDFLDLVPRLRFKQGPRTFLTAEEIQRLVDTPCENENLRRAFMFSVFTGLRYSDIRALTWRNIEKDYICLTVQKTGETARLPLNQNAKQLLPDEKIIDPDARVFTIPVPNRTNPLLRIWARRAGIDKHLTFHVGRHTYAFLLLKSGLSMYDVQKSLDHSSIAMTEIYAHMIPEELKQRIDEKLPSFKLKKEVI